MPAITSLTYGAAKLAARAAAAMVVSLGRAANRVVRTIRNRRDAARLARFDDRMLADIGLTRGDVCEALSGPVWRDPAPLLAKRYAEWCQSRPALRLGAADLTRPKPGAWPFKSIRPSSHQPVRRPV